MKTVKFTQTPAEYFESRNGGKSAEKMMDDDEMITPTYALILISEYVLDCAKFIESDMSHPSLPSKEQVIKVFDSHPILYHAGTFILSDGWKNDVASEILSLSPVEGKEEIIELIDKYWKFDEGQGHLSTWHDKQDLIKAISELASKDNTAGQSEIELLKKVIEKYQFFTRWILKHTPEIKESERGLNHLNDIDWAEHKVKGFEQSGEPKDNNAGQSDEKHLTDENIAVEIIARFLGNPHLNQRHNYDREKIAFANGMKAARDFYEGKNKTKG